MTTDPPPPGSEGLEGSLRRFARALLQVLQTRLEILSTEVAEEELNLTRLALGVLAVLFCVQAGLLLAVLFLVLIVGGEQRLMAVGVASLALLLGAVIGGLLLRRWLKRRSPIFGATIGELRKDWERLRSKL